MNTTTNSPETFVKALDKAHKVNFDNGVLKVEAHREEPRNSKREFVLKYFHRVGERWVSFCSFTSPFLHDLKIDFTETVKSY